MINNYSQYDIFLITKDNWKNQKNIIYGYRYPKGQGFWLNVVNENNVLTITGSFLQPPIAIYRNNDYWAISNSLKVLKDFLDENNFKITQNPLFPSIEDLNSKGYTDGYSYYGYPETATAWSEIELTPNFSYIEIIEDILYVKEKKNELFSGDFLSSKKIVEEWFKQYYFYFYDLNIKKRRICTQISGGLDSRFLINFWKNIDVSKIICRWKKDGDRIDDESLYLDGILGRLVTAYTTNQQKKINSHDVIINEVSEEYDHDESKIFWYGFCLDMLDNIDTKLYIKDNPKLARYIVLSGVGTEWLKGESISPVDFILGTVRRYFIPKFLRTFYLRKEITVVPYLDSKLLKLKGEVTNIYLLMLYLRYSPELLDFPFYGREKLYWITEKEKEKAAKLLEEWK